jgi:Pyruvate/2-oxoacid:ferredoxin oxidoreductase delta subunit
VRQGAPLPWGVWTTLLTELGRAGGNSSLPADSPLRSYRNLIDEVDQVVRSLKQRRNDLAHQRVPPTHRIAAQAAEARAELELLLAAAEWLSDYPLRHIEEVRWDSFANESVVHFRELMGDHHVVALKSGRTAGNLEVASPYVADQFGHYHLLRPLFHTEHCDSCGQLSLFVLDRWIDAEQTAEYKALDHGDICRVPAGNALRGAGILPR